MQIEKDLIFIARHWSDSSPMALFSLIFQWQYWQLEIWTLHAIHLPLFKNTYTHPCPKKKYPKEAKKKIRNRKKKKNKHARASFSLPDGENSFSIIHISQQVDKGVTLEPTYFEQFLTFCACVPKYDIINETYIKYEGCLGVFCEAAWQQ